MFRVQNLVPEVYPDKSRDFQMFCRAYDVAFNGVKYSIDSMSRITDTSRCDARLLELLKTKLGFFSQLDISDEDLRFVLQAFPSIMKYKGSVRAINYIVALYSRIVAYHKCSCDIRTIVNNGEDIIEISSEFPIIKTDLLVSLLRLVAPAGYIVDYYVTTPVDIVQNLYVTGSLEYNTQPGRNYKTVIAIEKSMTQTVNITEITSQDTERINDNE